MAKKRKGKLRIKQRARVAKKGDVKKAPNMPLTPHDNGATLKVKVRKK